MLYQEVGLVKHSSKQVVEAEVHVDVCLFLVHACGSKGLIHISMGMEGACGPCLEGREVWHVPCLLLLQAIVGIELVWRILVVYNGGLNMDVWWRSILHCTHVA